MLSHLLLLDTCRKFVRELEVGDRDIVELKVELSRSSLKLLLDILGDFLPHCDQLSGIILRHNGLEDLAADRWEHSLVIIFTEVIQNL